MDILKRLIKDKGVRNKFIWTFVLLFALLIGNRIPMPGVNKSYLSASLGWLINSGAGSALNMLTGNALSQMSIFALSISPYITASIAVQMLRLVIKPLDNIAKDGSVGKAKMEKIIFAGGAIIAFVEALTLAIKYGQAGLFYHYNAWTVIYSTAIWTAGACFMTWMGQMITNKLLGNGISMILMFNILTTLPDSIKTIHLTMTVGRDIVVKNWAYVGIMAAFMLMIAYVYILQTAEIPIKVANASKAGVIMKKADESTMPLKLNVSGVMPVILSSSSMAMLATVLSFFSDGTNKTLNFLIACCNQVNWFRPVAWQYTIGAAVFVVLTFAFSKAYSLMGFNVNEIANNFKQTGGIVEGNKPGEQTAKYLQNHVNKTLWLGTSMLVVIALIPNVISGALDIMGLSFGGTSIIIVVSAIVELKNSIIAKSTYAPYNQLFRVGKEKTK